MNKAMHGVLYAFLAVILADCVGTEVGNPPADVEIDFVSIEEEEPINNNVIANLTLSNGVTIDRAVIVVGSLRFLKCGLGENESDASVTEPFLAELLSENMIEARIDLPTGTYCRLDVRPIRGGEDGLFSDERELQGYTVYAEGSYRGIPLFSRYEGDDEIEFLGEFTIAENTTRLFIAVDVATWFDGVDLENAEIEDEGEEDEEKIVLGGGEDGGNEGLLDRVGNNFEASITVAVDDDGDGILDPTELTPED